MKTYFKNMNQFLMVAPLTLFIACSESVKNVGSKSNSTPSQSGNIVSADNDLIDEFLRLTNDYRQLSNELNQSIDLRGKLQIALTSASKFGCKAEEKITSVEVIVNGEKLEDLDVSAFNKGAVNLPPLSIESSKFVIMLSNLTQTSKISLENNEATNPLFTSGARRTFPIATGDMSIGSIDQIIIKKPLPTYSVVSFCPTGSKDSVCANNQTVKELERYLLKTLTIKINGQIIYSNSNVGKVFAINKQAGEGNQPASLEWVEQAARLNGDFVKLMQVDDCSQQGP